MKIAVIGTGISGLASAYYLSRGAEVHVFEAGSYIGGHTHTHDIQTDSGRYAIDTGFIVFNDRTYPKFIKLMTELGVPSQLSDMSFSVKVEKNGLEYNGTDLNRLFAQRSNLFRPSFYKMIFDILRFNKEAPKILDTADESAEIPLGKYLMDNGYSKNFVDHYIIPMGAAIWSAGVAQMREFPTGYFVRFFKNHGMLSVDDRPLWRVIKGGSSSYIPAITAPYKDRIHLNSPVRAVRRDADGVALSFEQNGKADEARFDHVVMSSHADQSLKMLLDATPAERDLLGAFPYQRNDTLLHTDTSVLPRRSAWAAWNYLVPERESDVVAVTYDMNILQSLPAPETFLVSLNMENRIDPSKVLKKMIYHHPVYSMRSVAAQKRWREISGQSRRTHFCGAYWGFGFHEDGLASAHRVAETFGIKP